MDPKLVLEQNQKIKRPMRAYPREVDAEFVGDSEWFPDWDSSVPYTGQPLSELVEEWKAKCLEEDPEYEFETTPESFWVFTEAEMTTATIGAYPETDSGMYSHNLRTKEILEYTCSVVK